mgnify:CR=1 FL=1
MGGAGAFVSVPIDDVLGPDSPLARRLAGYELRGGQLEMARAVDAAFKSDRHLFVEAGTGTGKTLAYLVPAILSGKKVVISTATHALQEQIFEKDLPLVREVLGEHGVTFRAALMKGLSNYLCKRRLSERMTDGDQVSTDLIRIRHWAGESRTGDRAELAYLEEGSPAWRDVHSSTDTRIGAGCKYYDECFVTHMRRQAEDASLIVVNHHLFFADLALRTGKGAGFGGVMPPYDAVVFDEAHQIENVATDFFGARVSTSRIDALIRDARRAVASAGLLDSTSARIVDSLEHASGTFFRTFQRGDDFRTSPKGENKRVLSHSDWTPARRDALLQLDAAIAALFAYASGNDRDDTVAIVARRAGELRSDLTRISAAALEDRHWEPDFASDEALSTASRAFDGGVTWLDARDRSVSLGASPIELGPILRERLFDRVPSVVCTSATLATATGSKTELAPSFFFAKSRLGALPETGELVVKSPFDFESRAALYVAEDLPEPTDPAFEAASIDRILELLALTGGGAFVLCTSNRAMRVFDAALSGKTPGPVLVQGKGPKHLLLERFRKNPSSVLVATMSFWEGVDVPGRALRLVVLDKIPFAVPSDPLVVARSRRIEADGGNPFTQYAVPTAAITLKQGFGRLIRTREDTGIVALLDRRAVRRGYGRALLASLPPARRLTALEDVREFWHALECDDAAPDAAESHV